MVEPCEQDFLETSRLDRRTHWRLGAGKSRDSGLKQRVVGSVDAPRPWRTQARTTLKSVRSSEGHVEFSPEELRPVLKVRSHKGINRLRAVFQSSNTSFASEEFDMYVGTTILAARIEPLRIKMAEMIDNTALDNYSFEAKLVIWEQAPGHDADVFTYGGQMSSGNSDIRLDPALQYRWDDVKLVYLGPDDARIVRTELLGF